MQAPWSINGDVLNFMQLCLGHNETHAQYFRWTPYMGRLSKQVVVFHNESAVNTTHLPPYDLYEHTLKKPQEENWGDVRHQM